jgi:hypothetical protein
MTHGQKETRTWSTFCWTASKSGADFSPVGTYGPVCPGWVHTGSINGSENSSKSNRELALQVKSTQAYNYLATVFWHDWVLSGGEVPRARYLPLVLK